MILGERVLGAGLWLVAGSASGEIIRICADGSGDHAKIQAGIDAASEGDEIIVCDGEYRGPGMPD